MPAYGVGQVELINDLIVESHATITKMGTVTERDATGTRVLVAFDGSSGISQPVKCPGSIIVATGDRVGLTKYESDWIISVNYTADARIPAALAGIVPIGGILMWSGSSVPGGWALCDGSNGTPNLVNRFIMGSTTGGAGATGGSSTTTLTEAQMPSHSHSFTTGTSGTHGHGIHARDGVPAGSGYDFATLASSGTYTSASMADDAGSHTHGGATNVTGSDNSFDNRPAYYTLAYIQRIS